MRKFVTLVLRKVIITEGSISGSSLRIFSSEELPSFKNCVTKTFFPLPAARRTNPIAAVVFHGLLDRERVLSFLKEKPEKPEIVLTGRDPAPELVELADYVSEIQKKKRKIFVFGHPEYDRRTLEKEYLRDKGKGLPIQPPKDYFEGNDKGRSARKGIEW